MTCIAARPWQNGRAQRLRGTTCQLLNWRVREPQAQLGHLAVWQLMPTCPRKI
jgi:hypothetical protein